MTSPTLNRVNDLGVSCDLLSPDGVDRADRTPILQPICSPLQGLGGPLICAEESGNWLEQEFIQTNYHVGQSSKHQDDTSNITNNINTNLTTDSVIGKGFDPNLSNCNNKPEGLIAPVKDPSQLELFTQTFNNLNITLSKMNTNIQQVLVNSNKTPVTPHIPDSTQHVSLQQTSSFIPRPNKSSTGGWDMPQQPKPPKPFTHTKPQQPTSHTVRHQQWTTPQELNQQNPQPHNWRPNAVGSVDFNTVPCLAPPLDLGDIKQSLRDFTTFCNMAGVPVDHQRRLLLEELKIRAPHVLTEFVRAHESNPSYSALTTFLLNRFESVPAIHRLELNPQSLNLDAYAQFNRAVNLYEKTPPEEVVKFFVLRTSPPELQKAMVGSLSLPYDMFFAKYKNKLAALGRPHCNLTLPISFDPNCHPSSAPRNQSFPPPHTAHSQSRELTHPAGRNLQSQLSENTTLCHYHLEFGKRARNCSSDSCSMKHLTPQAIQNFLRSPKNAQRQVNPDPPASRQGQTTSNK